jgi:hypothetical protein
MQSIIMQLGNCLDSSEAGRIPEGIERAEISATALKKNRLNKQSKSMRE